MFKRVIERVIMANGDHAALLWAAAQTMLMLMFFSVFVFAQNSSVQSNAAADCIASERIILLQFKATLDETDAPLPSWNKEATPNCCRWDGVSCDKDNNHVVALSLSECGLLRSKSVAPSEVLATISKLHMLQSLDLSLNFGEDSSSGISIPPEVGALRNLLFLNLSHIELSSEVIPMHIGNLSSLKMLDLAYAERAVLPTEALLSLSNLEDLRLDGVSLQHSSNWGKSICKLHNIKTLSMNGVILTGPLPACLKNLTHLTYFSLDDNQLFGISPFFNIVANLTSLVYLSARYANISDFIPTSASVNFPASLSYLDLSNNNFSGDLLRSLCSLTSLKYLDLSTNAFEGTIPSCIGNLTRLNTLLLHDNQIQGSIPSSISLLTSLTKVDFSSNLLNGTFSFSLLKNFTGLTILSLSHNLPTVKCSQSWPSLMQLRTLRLNSCNMKGGFPSFLRHNPFLEYLSLADNNLVGSLPSWIWKFENLVQLDLSLNNFTGSVPSDIRSLSTLMVLNLRKNKLYGLPPSSFPRTIQEIRLSHNLFNGSLSSFKILDGAWPNPVISLAYNNISGRVPWADIMKLKPTELDLSQNNLRGQLTPLENLSNDCRLRVLNLDGNQFSGAIPNLLKCSGLWIMDIGNNKMHGSVPKWIGKLKDLEILILRANNFHGKIPQELLMLNKLQILDVSSNKLSGFLPAGFGSLTTMAFQGNSDNGNAVGGICTLGSPCYQFNATSELKLDNKGIYYDYSENVVSLMRCIDVSNNRFIGEIPDEIGLLKGLIILNMSYNDFGGKIPKSLANISELDSLDLSNNYLSGEIPPELASLSMLGDLNLSCNNLTGKIPNQGHLTTFSASSFTGNPGLCGFQIDKECPHKNNSSGVDLKTMHSKNGLHYLLFWLACGLSFGLGFAAVIIVMSFTAFGKKCFAIFDSIIYSMEFYILFMLARIQALF